MNSRTWLNRLWHAALFGVLLNLTAVANAQTKANGTAMVPATAKATFAGGCFWCVESDFDKMRLPQQATWHRVDSLPRIHAMRHRAR